MNKFIYPALGLLLLICSCNSTDKPVTSPVKNEQISVFPVTEFLLGQIAKVENSPVTPLKLIIVDNHADSIWITRDSLRGFSEPFLTPLIDSASLSTYFDGASFLDQTINSFTFTYDANRSLPPDIFLRTIDVYVDPESGTVTKVYLLKEKHLDNAFTKVQLTWNTDKWCSIRTIVQKDGESPEIKEEKVIWDFD